MGVGVCASVRNAYVNPHFCMLTICTVRMVISNLSTALKAFGLH